MPYGFSMASLLCTEVCEQPGKVGLSDVPHFAWAQNACPSYELRAASESSPAAPPFRVGTKCVPALQSHDFFRSGIKRKGRKGAEDAKKKQSKTLRPLRLCAFALKSTRPEISTGSRPPMNANQREWNLSSICVHWRSFADPFSSSSPAGR